MLYFLYITFSLLFIYNKSVVLAWTSEELELFDLVDDINQNFYELLNLDQSASVTDIKKAYRRLSLLYHPDKNKEEGAEEQFRKIVAVSDVLKDEERRKQYDLILQNGLPDWKMPIFYYRRVRKMGLFELFAFLSVLLTSGHFILLWATYWERKYELETRFRKKKPKKSKTQETSSDDPIASQVSLIPKPALNDLLPALIVKYFVNFILEIPAMVSSWRRKNLNTHQSDENSSEDDGAEEKVRKPRKKIKPELPDYDNMVTANANGIICENHDDNTQQYSEIEVNKPREWNEQDTRLLVKAMNKFPGGTSHRWEKIAASLKRTVEEVTVKVKTLKSSAIVNRPCTALQGLTGKEASPLDNSVAGPHYDSWKSSSDSKTSSVVLRKTKLSSTEQDLKNADSESAWSQLQQKSLESALQKFPKGCEERWDRIAEQVPGKNKEECLLRYKDLAESIRKKKLQTIL